jgi:hypothetical protein
MDAEIPPRRNLGGITESKVFQAVRKMIGRWHFCAIDENRDQRYLALERRLDFNADGVLVVIDSVFVAVAEPSRTNDREHEVAL